MKKEKLKIIYEDKDLIVLDKKAGMLTIGTDKEKENTLYHKLLMFQKQKNKNNKIFIVHRLDKNTSGLIIFAKNEKTKRILQDNWDKVERKYYAVVNGEMKNNDGEIKSYLAETKTLLVYSTNNEKIGKFAQTNYSVISKDKDYSLIDVDIKTGRKNQIRVQLNDIGHPIVGDKKYSKIKKDPLRKLCLYAYSLRFIHPHTKKEISIVQDIPKEFLCLMKKSI